MSFTYTTALIAGVEIKCQRVTKGYRTKFNQDTGEPYEEPVYEYQNVTESGVAWSDPSENMTDEELDDWINPEAGDFCFVGGEAEICGLGVMIGTHDPKYDEKSQVIDSTAIAGHIEKAKGCLLLVGITDPVRVMMLSVVC